MFLQIHSRDSIIEELNKEILELRSSKNEKKTNKDPEETIQLKLVQQRVFDLEHEIFETYGANNDQLDVIKGMNTQWIYR